MTSFPSSSLFSFFLGLRVWDGVLGEGVGQVKMRGSVGTSALMRTRQTNIFIPHVKATRALRRRAQGAHLWNRLEQVEHFKCYLVFYSDRRETSWETSEVIEVVRMRLFGIPWHRDVYRTARKFNVCLTSKFVLTTLGSREPNRIRLFQICWPGAVLKSLHGSSYCFFFSFSEAQKMNVPPKSG